MPDGTATTFYLSPEGDDRWSGRLPAPNADRSDGPLATLARAREVAREDCRVLLRGGRYVLPEAVVFTAEDSGVTYAAYPGEQPVLSGGVRIEGWQQTTVNGREAWIADAPAWPFHQLWVDGGRRGRSRLPQSGFYRIPVSSDADWYGGANAFSVRPGDVKASWQNLQDVEVVLLTSWVESRLPLVSVDEETGEVHTKWRSAIAPSEGSRYYIENVFEAFTGPGTWYCDRAAEKLYYLPYPGEDPATAEVIVPRLTTLIRLEGAERMRFDGLTFAHTEWRRSDDTPIMRYEFKDLIYMPSVVDDKASDHLSAVNVPGAVVAVNARECRFMHCTVEHTGGYGIELGYGSRENEIAACAFRDLGAGGVKLGTQNVADAPVTFGNRVVDCEIGSGGHVFHGAVGVWVGQSPHNLVAHNHIHDLYYTGISVGWAMGYAENAAHHNLIEGNHIHHLGKAVLSDFGGIYLLGEAPGTRVCGNVVHDLASGEYGACGLYYDEGTCHVVGENNLLYNIDGDAFFMHYGHDNVLRNNILAGCAKGALGSSVDVLDRSHIGEHCAVTIERNIIFLREGEVYRSNWPPARFAIRHNLVWDANWRPLFCGGLPWEEWQRQGMDESSFIADPLFADPDRGDFTLDPASPAFALGFIPFELTAGPRVPVGAEHSLGAPAS